MKPCYHRPNDSGENVALIYAKFSMLFVIWHAVVVSGECCRVSIRNGKPFIITFACGVNRNALLPSMTNCDKRLDLLLENKPLRARRSLIRNQSKPMNKPPQRGMMPASVLKAGSVIILVDTLGLLLKAKVLTANVQDRDGAKMLFSEIKEQMPPLRLIWADGGYRGKLIVWVAAQCLWILEIVKRNDQLKGFVIVPKRWIVERTFSWLNRNRRLSKDYVY